MPIKLRPSAREFVRKDRFSGAIGKSTIKHHYIKAISQKELFEELNKHNTKPKVKQKIRHELTRRGIKIIKRTKIDE
jgi:hypothetical protein|tara:strand:+ start:6088 stop:6318 length:231 start_codon:yes stop_codon:yes gene_type:complete